MVMRMRVLVVDDDGDTAESFRILLVAWGYDVRVAATGPDALSIASDYRPAAVFLDIQMPGLSGYEVARAFAALTHRPFIAVVSGFGAEEDRKRSADAGADVHLVKPADLDEIKKLLAVLYRVTTTIRD
jgi:DNA-binding response OmpR family regulator